MNINPNEIQHPTGNWLVQHDLQRAGGPQLLQADEKPLLKNFHCRYDDMSDDLLVADKVRLFRKGGAAVFSSEGHFPFGAEIALRQNIRYAANHARITTDLRWKKGAGLKQNFAIGSCELPGCWEKVLVIPADGSTHAWQELSVGNSCTFSPLPLALVFCNQQGQRLEIGTGDDLWRWDNGLTPPELPAKGSIKILVQAESLLFQRIMDLNSGAEELFPAARDYRFTSYLAWSAPALQAEKFPLPEDFTPLKADRKEGLTRQQLLACGSPPAISLDFNQLQLPDQAKHTLQPGICWESKITQRCVRRLIRQLAEYSTEGFLLITGGMTPGLCDDPVHCSRKKITRHWDMTAILDLVSWTQQRLGNGWQTRVLQPAPWNELPSLSCLAALNGFRLPTELANDNEE
ncbi:MAG: hypothetical protein WCT05_16290 [Lentisphaeria bacterium]